MDFFFYLLFFLYKTTATGIDVVGRRHVELTGLTTGALYFVRVAARNGLGLGEWRATQPISRTPVDIIPFPVVRPEITVVSDSEILVQWTAPRFYSGKPVTKYEIEWDTAASFTTNNGRALGTAQVDSVDASPINDRQIVRVSATANDLSGYFVLSYDGQRTRPLSFDVSAVDMKKALEDLATVASGGGVQVYRNMLEKAHVDDRAHYGFSWDIHFDASKMIYPGNQYEHLSTDDSGIRGTHASANMAQLTEKQELRCLTTGAGNLRLRFEGKENDPSDDLSRTATAHDVEMLLLKLLHDTGHTWPSGQSHPSHNGDVIVTPTNPAVNQLCNGNSISANAPFTVEFRKRSVSGTSPLVEVAQGTGLDVRRLRAGTRQFVVGRQMFSYRIRSLLTTSAYYVRVAGYNVVGFGTMQATTPIRLTPTTTAPMLPTNVQLTVSTSNHVHNLRENAMTGASTALSLSWSPPISTGGPTISSYLVEWDRLHTFDSTCGNVHEVQSFNVTAAGGASDQFRVHVNVDQGVDTTACLSGVATASQVETAINTNIFSGLSTVSVKSCVVGDMTTYTMTFIGIQGDVLPFVVATDAGCTGAATVTTVAEEVQGKGEIILNYPLQLSCDPEFMRPEGSFVVRIPGGTGWPERMTHEITNLMPGEEYYVRIAASSDPDANNDGRGYGPYEFAGPLFDRPRNVPGVPTMARMTVHDPTSLFVQLDTPDVDKSEGSNGDAVSSYQLEWIRDGRTNEIQIVAINGTGKIHAGQYRLNVYYSDAMTNIETLAITSTCIDFNAPARQLRRSMETIAGVDHVTVTRKGDGTVSSNYGYQYTVSFDGEYLNGPIRMMAITDIGVNGCAAWVSDGIATQNIISSVSGIAGGVQEIVTLSSTASSEITSGYFDFSVGYLGDFTQALSGTCEVYAGSRIVRTTIDVTGEINRGDRIQIGNEILLVSTDPQDIFDCTTVTLSSFHQSGVVASTQMFVMDTRIGSVHPVSTQSYMQVVGGHALLASAGVAIGDYVAIGNGAGGSSSSAFGATTFHRVEDLNTTHGLTVASNYNLDSDDAGAITPATRMTVYKRKIVQIASTATAGQVKNLLESLPDVGSVDVIRTGPTAKGEYVWTVTFTSLSGSMQKECASGSPCIVTKSTLTNTAGDAQVPIVVLRRGVAPTWESTDIFDTSSSVLEVQTITSSNVGGEGNTILSGKFDILVGGPGYPICATCGAKMNSDNQHVVTVHHNITAHDLRHRLEALEVLGRVNVVHQQPGLPSLGSKWTITYLSSSRNLPPLHVDGTNLVGSNAAVATATTTEGSWPGRRHVLPSLTAGDSFYVRVSGRNVVGLGPSTSHIQNVGRGMIPLVQTVRQQPARPGAVSMFAVSSSQLELRWDGADGVGNDVDRYLVEWWSTGAQTSLPLGLHEKKYVRLNNTADDTQGFFVLTFNGETTARMEHNVAPEEMKRALENLHSITEVSVTKYQAGPFGFQWTIVWSQAYGDQGALTLTQSLVGTSTTMSIVESGVEETVDGTLPPDYGSYVMNTDDSICGGTLDSSQQGSCSEGIHQIQTILSEGNSALTGTFRLTVNGVRTGHIAHDSTAAQVKTKIESILRGSSTVEVLRHSAPVNGYAWYVTFSDATPIDLMEPEDDYMVGTDAVVNVFETLVVQSGAQRNDITGFFRLHLGTEYTEWLTHDCTPAQMQRALELLYGVGHVVVTRETSVNYGYVWRIICKVVTADLNTMRAVPAGLNEIQGTWPEVWWGLDSIPLDITPWRGTGVTLSVQHPTGRVPNTYLIGTASEVQTITVKASKADMMEITVAGAYKLSYDGVKTQCIDWHAETAVIETQLEGLAGIDQVSVTRVGDGKRAHNYGYVYTITFWGTMTGQDNVQPLSIVPPGTDGCVATSNADPNTYYVHQNTLREGIADARYNHDYVSLRETTNYQARVTALNVEGYGLAGVPAPLTTPQFGIEPDAPESVAIAKRYGGDFFSVDFHPPARTGGDLITKYKIEWDTTPTFNSGTNFGTRLSSMSVEIQEIVTMFKSIDQRDGTFTLKWGGQMTDALAWDCTEDRMAAQLQLITSGGRVGINPIEVARESYGNGIKWLVTFHHGWGDMQLLEEDYTLLEGYDPKVTVREILKGSKDIAPGEYTFEQQTIRTSSLSPITGDFQLEFEGHITGNIPFNANKTHMKLAMEQLLTIYTVNVEVEDSYDQAQAGFGARTWTVTFSHLFHESIQGAGDIGLLVPRFDGSAGVGSVAGAVLNGNGASVEIVTRVVGTDPLQIDVVGGGTPGGPEIITGQMYYVRVAAFNSRGYGPWSNVAAGVPRKAPAQPINVVLSTNTGTSLKASWTAPSDTGGVPVNQYKVQWYTAQGTPEIQLVTTSASSTTAGTEIQTIESRATVDNIYGFFTLSFRGEKTKSISHSASAADVKDALELLSTIGTINVVRTLSQFPMPGTAQAIQGQNSITVTSDPALFKVPLLRGHLVYVAGEEFRVSTDLARTFDATTIPLSLSSNAATPATFVGATVASTTYYRWAYGYEWRVEFRHGHVGNQPTIIAAASTRPGEGWDGEKVTLNTLINREGLQPLSGTFRLSYKGHTTRRLAHNIGAQSMANALTSLIDAGPLSVDRIINGNGYNWLITFDSDLGNLAQIHPNDVQLTGPSAKMSAATRVQGIAPANLGTTLVASQLGKITYEQIVPNLIQGMPYMCRITASNTEGYGGHAISTPTVQTPRERPPTPKKTELIVMTDDTLKVVIHKPVTDGGADITKYLIEWDTDSTFSNILTSGYQYVHSDLTNSPYIPYFFNVPNLVTGTTYFFRVSAYNDQGYGPTMLTDPPFAKPATRVPGLPLSTTVVSLSNWEIQVGWDVPSRQLPTYGGDGGRAVTHYLIEWDDDYNNLPVPSTHVFDMTGISTGTTKLTHIVGFRDPMTGVTISELDGRESQYKFRVTAYNAEGYGNATWCSPAPIRPIDRVPFPPTSITATATSGSTIATTWQMPVHDGGHPIERFQLEWDTSGTFTNKSQDYNRRILPVTTETQSFSVRSDVVNEVQTIGATVGVINERQQFSTMVVGVNEIQTIKTDAKPVVPEIQTVTTYATDHDEIQILQTTAMNVDEVQSIRSDIPHLDEIQTINVTAMDEDEIQRIIITEPRNTQIIKTRTTADTCATTAGGADRTAATDCGAANNAACNQQANCEASVTAPATWSATNNAACNQQANCEASVTAPATWTAGITVTGTLAADLTGAGMVTVSIISPIDYVFDNSNILTIGTNPLNAVAQANIVSVTHVETKSVPTSGEFQLCYANNCTNCIPWGSKGYVVSEQLVEFVPEITGVTTTLSVSTDATELEYRILFNGA